MLHAVATQVDSALDHLKTLRDSEEHALQIETIYRIDQVRDEASSEIEMLSAVANIVTSTLNADLCLMSLVNEETGKSELKAIEDRQGVFSQLDREAIAGLGYLGENYSFGVGIMSMGALVLSGLIFIRHVTFYPVEEEIPTKSH